MIEDIDSLHYSDSDKFDVETNVLCEYINVFIQNNRTISGDNRVLLYRGQSNISFNVTPSVFRSDLLLKEHELINELLLRSPNEFTDTHDPFERLVKMQHYGLPTRLLDVTTNPLVALYFACASDGEYDGEILVLCENMERPDSTDVKRISALASYYGSQEKQMISYLQEKNLLPIGDMEKISEELKSTRTRQYIAVATPLNNERIKRQQGAFLLMGVPEIEGHNPFSKNIFDIKPLLSKIDMTIELSNV